MPKKTTSLELKKKPVSLVAEAIEPKRNYKTLTSEMVAKLKAPLPAEAISQHPTKTYLSSIKAIYVVERLNDVFGIGQWQQRNEVISDDSKMKTVHSWIDINEYNIHLDNFGGNDNSDEGDAFKGAVTDALTKMASYLGIGMDVYKGLATPSGNSPTVKNTNTTIGVRPATEKQKAVIGDLMAKKNISVEQLADAGIIAGKTPPTEVIQHLIDAKPNPINDWLASEDMTDDERELVDEIEY